MANSHLLWVSALFSVCMFSFAYAIFTRDGDLKAPLHYLGVMAVASSAVAAFLLIMSSAMALGAQTAPQKAH